MQRQTVYRTIVRVPPAAPLYTVPDTVAVDMPAVRPYRDMVVNNRVVLVDPATSEVVAELTD